MDILQLTLVAGLIVMAIVNAASLVWASYLDHKLRGRPTPKHYDVHLEGNKVFPEMDMTKVQQEISEQLQVTVSKSADQLQRSISQSVEQIAGHVQELASTSLASEFEKYQVSLAALREQTIAEFGKIHEELDQHRTKLQAQLEQKITEQESKRLDQFNARLNDIVSSYLAESLGAQVDLGAQTTYIMQTLQQHKEDIKRDVLT